MTDLHTFVLSGEALAALQDIVEQWIGERFTAPPYKPEVYDIFEVLALDPDDEWRLYDIRRPR